MDGTEGLFLFLEDVLLLIVVGLIIRAGGPCLFSVAIPCFTVDGGL